MQRYKLGGFSSRLHVRVLSVDSIDGESGYSVQGLNLGKYEGN